MLKPGEVLDGELYMYGESLQTINRYVRKYREGLTEQVEYWVYDSTTTDGSDKSSFMMPPLVPRIRKIDMEY